MRERRIVNNMYTIRWFWLVGLVGCSTTTTSKEDSTRAFEAMTAVAAAAQSAVADHHAAALPAALAVQFDGPCAGGGTMHVDGTVDNGTGTGTALALDMSFAQCRGAALGDTVDGDLELTSEVSPTNGVSQTMKGHVAVDGTNLSVSCDFDLTMIVNSSQVSETGSMCGYDVQLLIKH